MAESESLIQKYKPVSAISKAEKDRQNDWNSYNTR
jgi:hypothetical protein